MCPISGVTELLRNTFFHSSLILRSSFTVNMLGAVVVGIGTAGWVRIRDLLAPAAGSPAENLAVKGFVSR